MRLTKCIYLLIAASGLAQAHTPGSEDKLLLQLGHQLFGVHHLPLTALLLVVGIVLIRNLRNSVDHNETGLR